MRALLTFLLLTGTAHAGCNDTLLSFTDWSIKPLDAEAFQITTTFKSNADKPIRMIEARAAYFDALGAMVGSFELNRDASIQPGGTYVETKTWGKYTFERLLVLKHDEVRPFVCVIAVLFDDGTKQAF
ncbi:hypothetical protein [Mesorhizobium huakuii]|uniref:Uncharacterized protein n=1 Tax=Mesorhizobium huakuii TaxID=28104 RepID=A0A7G6T0W9_9HYPH|nr:hypothetical protein [Mesorhizobium huakuii]QND60401.1 hypothetical protein HB778_30530 [Mesorhizobium huakuii]